MPAPTDARYAESHEWHRLEGDTLTLGLTQFAVDELTDITYVEMKPVGTAVTPGESIGEVESVKATSDVYSALAGEIVEVNGSLADDPSSLNTDPYAAGWLVRIRVSDQTAYEALMDAATYDEKYGG